MTSSRQTGLIALMLTASVLATGCSTTQNLNPFNQPDKSLKETAAEGTRIAIIPDEQKLAVADGLQGADFYLPDPVAVTEWPLDSNGATAIPHVDAAPNLEIVWKRAFGKGSGGTAHVTAPPVASNGKIFVMDGEATVSAFDAASGNQVWRANLRPESKRDKDGFGGGLAVSGGKLFVSSGYRFVAELNADTGAVVWKTTTEQPIHAAPTASNGRMFVVAVDNTLLTFDTASGAEGWTYQALSEPARILAASAPAVAGDTVIASFGSGELVALRAANGNDLWNEALSRANRNNALSEIRDIPGRPTIYQGDVFAISHSGVFAATDLRTGQQRWTLPITGITTPWAAGDVVYVVSKNGEVVCASRETGLIYWIRDLAEGRSNQKGGMFSMGRKKKYIVRPVWSSPLLANGRLILTSSQGEMVVLNAKTGVQEKSVKLGGAALIGPVAVNGTIFVATDEAQLIALR